MTRYGPTRALRRPRRTGIVAVVLLLAGAVLLGSGLQGSDHPLAGPKPSAKAVKAAWSPPRCRRPWPPYGRCR